MLYSKLSKKIRADSVCFQCFHALSTLVLTIHCTCKYKWFLEQKLWFPSVTGFSENISLTAQQYTLIGQCSYLLLESFKIYPDWTRNMKTSFVEYRTFQICSALCVNNTPVANARKVNSLHKMTKKQCNITQYELFYCNMAR